MEILRKEFSKYSQPMFFTIGRSILYILGILMILGTFARRNESQFVLINLYVLCFIFIVIVVYDILIVIKKRKTYESHMVVFDEDHIVYVDHRGTFKLPYSDMSSYQLISDQLSEFGLIDS